MTSMNKKEAYERKSEGEAELLSAQLDEIKARARIASANTAIEFSRETDTFENTPARE